MARLRTPSNTKHSLRLSHPNTLLLVNRFKWIIMHSNGTHNHVQHSSHIDDDMSAVDCGCHQIMGHVVGWEMLGVTPFPPHVCCNSMLFTPGLGTPTRVWWFVLTIVVVWVEPVPKLIEIPQDDILDSGLETGTFSYMWFLMGKAHITICTIRDV